MEDTVDDDIVVEDSPVPVPDLLLRDGLAALRDEVVRERTDGDSDAEEWTVVKLDSVLCEGLYTLEDMVVEGRLEEFLTLEDLADEAGSDVNVDATRDFEKADERAIDDDESPTED